MKKILFLLLLVLLPKMASADIDARIDVDDIVYYIDFSNNEAIVGRSYSNSDNIVILSSITHNGKIYNVTSIGSEAFRLCTRMTSITIPNSVKSIGDGAFRLCGLTSITIPNSVTSIGNRAFEGCNSLASITIGNGVTTIGWDVFNDTPWFNNQPDGLVYAGKVAYKYKGTMPANTNIILKKGTTAINSSAFYKCSGLTSITIPNSVKSIGNNAFSGCSGLTSVTIPNSVTSIGSQAFYGCSGLTSVTIPNSVTSIGYAAFEGCSGLTSVTIPNSVTSIGSDAFWGCSGLRSVTIPNSVTSISTGAFRGCSGLTSIDIERDNTIYDSRNNCNAIIETATGKLIQGCNTTVIPNDVTSIGYAAFEGCSGLTSVTIPNSVTSIGSDAFWGCSGLTSVTIPNSVTELGSAAFWDCSGLTSVTIGNSITSIGEFAFIGCIGLTSITIPNSVTSIGVYAFSGCNGLTSVTIGNSVTSIGEYAFYYCTELTAVIVEGITPASITSDTFENANNANLYVPKGAKSAYAAADYWKDLPIIEYPSNDVNQDGQTNVVDVVDIARVVVDDLTDEVIRHMADQDNSSSVTVADAVFLVNEIVGNTNWAKPMMARRTSNDDVLKLTCVDGNRLSLQMEGNGRYAAFQFDLWLPDDVDVMEMILNDNRVQGHQLMYNKLGEGHYRIVALSTSANSFSGTSGELLRMTLNAFRTDDIHMDNIHFVTPDGSEQLFESLGVGDEIRTTFINNINNGKNSGKRTIYNLNGQRLSTPQKGLNVINGRKVVVK